MNLAATAADDLHLRCLVPALRGTATPSTTTTTAVRGREGRQAKLANANTHKSH